MLILRVLVERKDKKQQEKISGRGEAGKSVRASTGYVKPISSVLLKRGCVGRV